MGVSFQKLFLWPCFVDRAEACGAAGLWQKACWLLAQMMRWTHWSLDSLAGSKPRSKRDFWTQRPQEPSLRLAVQVLTTPEWSRVGTAAVTACGGVPSPIAMIVEVATSGSWPLACYRRCSMQGCNSRRCLSTPCCATGVGAPTYKLQRQVKRSRVWLSQELRCDQVTLNTVDRGLDFDEEVDV